MGVGWRSALCSRPSVLCNCGESGSRPKRNFAENVEIPKYVGLAEIERPNWTLPRPKIFGQSEMSLSAPLYASATLRQRLRLRASIGPADTRHGSSIAHAESRAGARTVLSGASASILMRQGLAHEWMEQAAYCTVFLLLFLLLRRLERLRRSWFDHGWL